MSCFSTQSELSAQLFSLIRRAPGARRLNAIPLWSFAAVAPSLFVGATTFDLETDVAFVTMSTDLVLLRVFVSFVGAATDGC